jgi:hypothetical protein
MSQLEAPAMGRICRIICVMRVGGRIGRALAEIEPDDSSRRIPVVVLTTSKDEADVLHV